MTKADELVRFLETDPIIDSEKAKMEKMKAYVGEEAYNRLGVNTPLRFIRGYYNIPEEEMLKNFKTFIDWRAKEDIDFKMTQEYEKEARFNQLWPAGIHGTSKSGHTVICTCIGLIVQCIYPLFIHVQLSPTTLTHAPFHNCNRCTYTYLFSIYSQAYLYTCICICMRTQTHRVGERIGKIDIKLLKEEFKTEEMIFFKCRQQERYAERNEKLTAQGGNTDSSRRYKNITVMDMESLGWAHCSTSLYSLIKEFISVNTLMYSETMYKTIIINAPWYFTVSVYCY